MAPRWACSPDADLHCISVLQVVSSRTRLSSCLPADGRCRWGVSAPCFFPKRQETKITIEDRDLERCLLFAQTSKKYKRTPWPTAPLVVSPNAKKNTVTWSAPCYFPQNKKTKNTATWSGASPIPSRRQQIWLCSTAADSQRELSCLGTWHELVP
jgi:hypothetical protein